MTAATWDVTLNIAIVFLVPFQRREIQHRLKNGLKFVQGVNKHGKTMIRHLIYQIKRL